jgi:hypothetical protein
MDDKIYKPEVIDQNPFPGEVIQSSLTQDSAKGGNYTPAITKEKMFPTKRIAVELIGQALNTRSKKVLQEFELVQSGGFRIGNYQSGISGEIAITPAGLVARNQAGIQTFAIEGETGNATFLGEVQSGAVITGAVAVGPNANIYIDGENERMIFYNNDIPAIVIGEV